MIWIGLLPEPNEALIDASSISDEDIEPGFHSVINPAESITKTASLALF